MSIRGEIEEELRQRDLALSNLERAEYDYNNGYLTAAGYNHYLSKVHDIESDEYNELKKSEEPSLWD